MAEGSIIPVNLEDYSGSDSSSSSDGEDQSQKVIADAALKASSSKAKANTAAQSVPSKRKRERKAVALRSKVWEHFDKFDEPIIAEVDGVNKQVGFTKKAECKYCKTVLAGDSRDNGTSSLKKHIEILEIMTPKTVEALICFQNWLKSDSIMALEYIPSIEEVEFYEEVEKERLEEVSQAALMGRLGTNNTIVEDNEDNDQNGRAMTSKRGSITSDASKISAAPPRQKTKLTKKTKPNSQRNK